MPRPRSDIRPRILGAARQRFLFEGVDGASLRRIAADARTNIGMIYYYFPEKDDLLLAVIEDVYARLLADLEPILDPNRSLAETLMAASRRLAEMSQEEHETVRLVVREMLISSTRREKLLQRFSQGHLVMVMRVVMAAIERGEIRRDVSPLVAMLSIGSSTLVPQLVVHSLVQGLTPGASAPDAATLAAGLIDNILHGLSPASRA